MKIRFAQLEAAHAAFGRYAALIIAKTRVQSGGSSLLHPSDAAMIIIRDNPLAKDQMRSDFPETDIYEVQDDASEDFCEAKTQDISHSSSDFFKEINFFVEHQNKYCQEFVEYVFSAWARRLDMNSELHASSMARTSVIKNQI